MVGGFLISTASSVAVDVEASTTTVNVLYSVGGGAWVRLSPCCG